MRPKVDKLIAPQGKCPIIIRDDDINYFTRTSMLYKLYSEAWRKGFKTSLCVVPNQKTINDLAEAHAFFIPPSERGKQSYHPISENQELVKYVRDKVRKTQASITLHGYSHEYWGTLPEFATKDTLELRKRLENGLRILRNTFDTEINVFVLPNETVSPEALNIIQEKGLTALKRKSVFDTFNESPLPQLLKQTITKRLLRIYMKGEKHDFSPTFMKPAIICSDLNRTKIQKLIWSLPQLAFTKLRTPQDVLRLTKKIFFSAYTKRECFAFFHHNYLYFYDWEDEITRKEMFCCFQSIIRYIDRFPELWKTTLNEFLKRSKLVSQVTMQWKGNSLQVFSPITVKDLALKIQGIDQVSIDDQTFELQEEPKILTVPLLQGGSKISLLFKKSYARAKNTLVNRGTEH
jgi:hypothetical protein